MGQLASQGEGGGTPHLQEGGNHETLDGWESQRKEWAGSLSERAGSLGDSLSAGEGQPLGKPQEAKRARETGRLHLPASASYRPNFLRILGAAGNWAKVCGLRQGLPV